MIAQSRTGMINVYAVRESGYRFGFNGMEKDDEVKGVGNSIDYGARVLDSRLGRFLSLDPLAKDFPWNSPYSYAENDVIRCIDLDGLEKVFVFGGADIMNTGVSKTTLKTAAEIEKFSNDNKLGYEVKTFNIAPWNPSQGTALDYIKKNYKKGESIIIYGYSLGGVAAAQLTKMLKHDGINVNKLVLIDAAFGPFSAPIEIPNNVESVDNYYQTTRFDNPFLSRGYPVVPQEDNGVTKMNNKPYDDKVKADNDKGLGKHGAMDEDTQKDAINDIKGEMVKGKKQDHKIK